MNTHIFQILFYGLLICFISACNKTPHTDTEHHHSAATEGIQLNNGQKWKVNDEMKPNIESGRAFLIDYEQSKSISFNDLAVQLSEANTALISSCTMSGASHDELHKWLHPHMELTAQLKEAQSEEEAEIVIEKLLQSYEKYGEYFE